MISNANKKIKESDLLHFIFWLFQIDLRRGTTFEDLLLLFKAQRSSSSKGLLYPVHSILIGTILILITIFNVTASTVQPTQQLGLFWLSRCLLLVYNYPLPTTVVDIPRRKAPFFFPFAKQWIAKDIPSYGSQSKRTKIAIHWFGKY